MMFSKEDKEKVIDRYTNRFKEFGYSQKSLGWGDKGKQEVRFEVLASLWDFKGKRVLDIGAGFGDFYKFIGQDTPSMYHGIELVPALVEEGNRIYGSNGNFKLSQTDFLEYEFQEEYDITIVSGTFNFKLVNGDNYKFIEDCLKKAFQISKEGVAANFITDRVDYHEELIFNTNPEKLLTIALGITKNLVFRSDYFPFEYSVFLNKDDSFDVKDTIFTRFKNAR
jgi:ubiquinone/menaquinone biosynthesis C-methylase UbiE